MRMTLEQINALKIVAFLAEELLDPEYNPFSGEDFLTTDNSMKIIRELIAEQEKLQDS